MHRPKIPKNPKIFRNYQARPWQSSKESWDSWESWACAWILHFVHQDSWESWACAGFMKVLCEIMLFIRKIAFSLCFLMVNLRIRAEGLHFLVEFLKMENRILVLHYWVFFFKTGDCNRNYFTYSVFKKHWYLQWFLHVPQFERWRCRYICDTPPPAGRPWEGGWPYIYIYTFIYIYRILICIFTNADLSYVVFTLMCDLSVCLWYKTLHFNFHWPNSEPIYQDTGLYPDVIENGGSSCRDDNLN